MTSAILGAIYGFLLGIFAALAAVTWLVVILWRLEMKRRNWFWPLVFTLVSAFGVLTGVAADYPISVILGIVLVGLAGGVIIFVTSCLLARILGRS